MFTFHMRFFHCQRHFQNPLVYGVLNKSFRTNYLLIISCCTARAVDLKLFWHRWPCVKGRLLWARNRGHCMLYSQMRIKFATGHCSLEHVVTWVIFYPCEEIRHGIFRGLVFGPRFFWRVLLRGWEVLIFAPIWSSAALPPPPPPQKKNPGPTARYSTHLGRQRATSKKSIDRSEEN